MKIEIKRKDDRCDYDCPFKDGDWSEAGYCLLFKEPLGPIWNFGSIDGWRCCQSCNKVKLNMED